MGTTIAGNQHIGSNYKKKQYIWKQGLGGINAEVELYEQDRIFVYQFNPPYDQRDDGVLAIEFYYYYRKPTTNEFWTYCYDPNSYYIYPFLAWYDNKAADGGKWGGISTTDSAKISLAGRDSGWIHVTLHVDEYIWGRYTSNGKTYDNPIYAGIYSPLPVFCWDTSSSYGQNVTPYEINWNFEEYEDESVYDLLTGGYLEDCYDSRSRINDYPTFYITYRDVTPESIAYCVNETAVMNVSSSLSKKANFKKMLAEIKAACDADSRTLAARRNGGRDLFSVSANSSKKENFKRSFFENDNAVCVHTKKQSLFKSITENPDVMSWECRKLGIKKTCASSLKSTCVQTRKQSLFKNITESPYVISWEGRKLGIKKNCASSLKSTCVQTRKQSLFKNITEKPDVISRENRKLGIKLSAFYENLIPSSNAYRMLAIKKTFASITQSTSSFVRRLWFIRNKLTEFLQPVSLLSRKNHLKTDAFSSLLFDDEHNNRMFFYRPKVSENQVTDGTDRKVDWKRRLEFSTDVETETVRKQVLFRFEKSESAFATRAFASRLFFRTVQSIVSFWDWLRGKIREANNVVTFFSPINLEINFECRI